MTTTYLTQYSTGTRWCASQEAVDAEITRLRSIAFFELETVSVGGALAVVGTVARRRKIGSVQSLRVQLVYPDDFPRNPPVVFDADRRFEPVSGSHQFLNYQLCLEFPDRQSFSKNEEFVTVEVLGASLNWLVKRELFDKDPMRGWPEDAEQHDSGWAYAELAWDLAVASRIGLLQAWVAAAVKFGAEPQLDQRCPCGGTKLLRDCHLRIGESVRGAVKGLRGRFNEE